MAVRRPASVQPAVSPGVSRRMKLKCQPDDFRVEELTDAQPGGSGRYTFYRLTKRDHGDDRGRRGDLPALEPLGAAGQLRRLEGPPRRHDPVPDDRRRPVAADEHARVRARAGGPADAARIPRSSSSGIGSSWCSATLDDGRARACARPRSNDIARVGLPNYFDDQRFGSVGRSGEFVAEAWLRGDHERALRLAMAEPNPSTARRPRPRRRSCGRHWGDWAEAKRLLPRSSARSIVTYLVDHPDRLPRRLRPAAPRAAGCSISRRSRATSGTSCWPRWLERHAEPGELVPVDLKVGTFPFPRGMHPERVRGPAPDELCRCPAPDPQPPGPLGAGRREGARRRCSSSGRTSGSST